MKGWLEKLLIVLAVLAAAWVIGYLFFSGFGKGNDNAPGKGGGGSGTTTIRLHS